MEKKAVIAIYSKALSLGWRVCGEGFKGLKI